MEILLGWIFFIFSLIFILLIISINPETKNFLLVAFLLRFICVLINEYELFTLPDSRDDARTFEQAARDFSRIYGYKIISDFFVADSFFISRILSIFYTTFGESKMMAQTISAFLGTMSVYLVFRLTIMIWDHASAIKAAWATAIFPTLILYSSLTLREPYIVFFLLIGLVGIESFFRKKNFFSLVQVVLSFYLLMLFHGGATIGGFVFFIYIFFGLIKKQILQLINLKINIFSVIFIFILIIPIYLLLNQNISIPYLPSLFDFNLIRITANIGLNDFAAYPSWLIINNNFELIYKSILKFFYFLYSPFIWEVRSFYHLLGLFDAMIYMMFSFYLIRNWRSILTNPITRLFLLILIAYVFVHGLGIGNFGTGIRHRSKFVVILIILVAPKIHKLMFSANKKIRY